MFTTTFRRAGLRLVAGLVLVLAFPAVATAQAYVTQVWSQLQMHHSTLGLADYQLQNYIIGSLNDGGDDNWTFYFDRRNHYVITGACDQDCSDLDLSLLSDGGGVLVKDTQSDDQPVIEFSPKKSGSYKLQVGMYACNQEPCYFGFGIFQK